MSHVNALFAHEDPVRALFLEAVADHLYPQYCRKKLLTRLWQCSRDSVNGFLYHKDFVFSKERQAEWAAALAAALEQQEEAARKKEQRRKYIVEQLRNIARSSHIQKQEKARGNNDAVGRSSSSWNNMAGDWGVKQLVAPARAQDDRAALARVD